MPTYVGLNNYWHATDSRTAVSLDTGTRGQVNQGYIIRYTFALQDAVNSPRPKLQQKGIQHNKHDRKSAEVDRRKLPVSRLERKFAVFKAFSRPSSGGIEPVCKTRAKAISADY